MTMINNSTSTAIDRNILFVVIVLLGKIIFRFFVALILLFSTLPYLLATLTLIRQRFQLRWIQSKVVRTTNCNDTNSKYHQQQLQQQSGMYIGRVWHTRFRPISHTFNYPLFVFGIHLDELYYNKTNTRTSHVHEKNETVSSVASSVTCDPHAIAFNDHLWPLSLIVSFRTKDHLKNGEGLIMPPSPATTVTTSTKPQHKEAATDSALSSSSSNELNLLYNRIYQLVNHRTNGKFLPNNNTHYIFLITHLSYYGYCFNPVSFYYIYERPKQIIDVQPESILNVPYPNNNPTNKLVAVIGEVSNTPWNEMYCYVLHEFSVDILATNLRHRNGSSSSSIQYIFPKRFHVSPFMEMTYNYEWTFRHFHIPTHPSNGDYSEKTSTTTTTTVSPTTQPHTNNSFTSIHVINNLRPIQQGLSQKNDESTTTTYTSSTNNSMTNNGLQFNATMHVHRHDLHPYRIAYYMSTYPIYCMIIQLWIHIQAFILFTKGISYQPHPNNDSSNTLSSRIIGTIMTPFFYVRDHYFISFTKPATESSYDIRAVPEISVALPPPRTTKSKIS